MAHKFFVVVIHRRYKRGPYRGQWRRLFLSTRGHLSFAEPLPDRCWRTRQGAASAAIRLSPNGLYTWFPRRNYQGEEIVIVAELGDTSQYEIPERFKAMVRRYCKAHDLAIEKALPTATAIAPAVRAQFRNEQLGEAMRRRREALGMSQNAVAARAGVSRHMIYLAERGEGSGVVNLWAISVALDTSLSQLVAVAEAPLVETHVP